jgi:hypothetical protein
LSIGNHAKEALGIISVRLDKEGVFILCVAAGRRVAEDLDHGGAFPIGIPGKWSALF